MVDMISLPWWIICIFTALEAYSWNWSEMVQEARAAQCLQPPSELCKYLSTIEPCSLSFQNCHQGFIYIVLHFREMFIPFPDMLSTKEFISWSKYHSPLISGRLPGQTGAGCEIWLRGSGSLRIVKKCEDLCLTTAEFILDCPQLSDT